MGKKTDKKSARSHIKCQRISPHRRLQSHPLTYSIGSPENGHAYSEGGSAFGELGCEGDGTPTEVVSVQEPAPSDYRLLDQDALHQDPQGKHHQKSLGKLFGLV